MKTINNNIEEVRVSFDNAKLLKEKGFNVPCTHYFILNFSNFKADFVLNQFKTPIEENKNILQLCATKQPHLALAPTHQVAIDWIRINFRFDITTTQDWDYGILKGYDSIIESIDGETLIDCGTFKSSEKAKEEAINHLLTKLI